MKWKFSQKEQGIFFILLAAFFFAMMNLFIRLSGDLPVMQKSFFRNLIAFFVAFFFILKKKERIYVGKGNRLSLAIRVVSGTVGIICNFYSVDHMNLSDATMLNKLSPFFAIIFSAFVLKEHAGKKDWAAVMLAFLGALFVIKPTLEMKSIPALLGLMGGLTAGLAYTFVRKLTTNGVTGSIIVFMFSGFSCLVSLPSLIFDYEPMSLIQLVLLVLTGIMAAGGQLFITAAYARASAKDISVFDYTQVIFTAVLGFFLLHQLPDAYSIIGYVIIFSVAILKWNADQKIEKIKKQTKQIM